MHPFPETKSVSCTAVITVTISFPCNGGSWGHDCTVAQMHKQARDDALGFVDNIRHKLGKPVKIIGEPKIDAITHEVERT